MTQPCDTCSQPSETPRCSRCLGYQAWAGNDSVRASGKLLDRAKADLAALPNLVSELARCVTEKGTPTGGGGGKPGSRPPMRLDVVHLVDEREKPLWWGEDPRVEDLGDRYGVLWQLASWTRVTAEEMPEAGYLAETPTVLTEVGYLLEAWQWIAQQQWADELCDDVTSLAARCRQSLGIRREYRPRCRYCRDVVEPVDTTHTTTTWEAMAYALCRGCDWKYQSGVELAALAKVQEPQPLSEIAREIGVSVRNLERLATLGLIKPEQTKRQRGRLFDLAKVREVATKGPRLAG